MDSFATYMNPYLGKLFNQINLDKTYVRGDGCWLWDQAGQKYLDFVGAFGALPFGHNPPSIWAALLAIKAGQAPCFVQPSCLHTAGLLAERLIALAPAGLKYVTFTNSGAESVEAAIKLARAATGRLRILSTENSFHGKTLGALSATNRESYQKPFYTPVEGFDKIPYGDTAALKTALTAHPGAYAAFIVEPIQGEGGIVVPPVGYLARVQQLCRENGTLLILDEIQTGLGRTGNLFAANFDHITPDIITLAKALGGGLLPIGAVLSTEAAYTKEFALKHSSTFAGNTLVCQAGLATLTLLTENAGRLLHQVTENGAWLLEQLNQLKLKYPTVIREIRGRGLMIGIDFGVTREFFSNSFLGIMAEQELLTPLIAAYLLNVEKLRVAPTLNGTSVIRLEPPLIVDRPRCEQALESIERLVTVLATGNTAEFLRHLVGGKSHLTAQIKLQPRKPVRPPDPEGGRFAFLVHPVSLRNYPDFDQSLRIFSGDELAELARRCNPLLEPFPIAQTKIVSATGQTAWGEFILVPGTAAELLALPRKEAVSLVRKAVLLARDRGAKIIGLGAYTSVITGGGLYLRDPGVALTTGNSYTVAAAVEALRQVTRRLNHPLEQATAAVIGAGGSIGRATALTIAGDVKRLLLVGNPQRKITGDKRLLKVAGEICRSLRVRPGHSPGSLGDRLIAFGDWPDPTAPLEAFIKRYLQWYDSGNCPLICSLDLPAMLPLADVLVTATNNPHTLIGPENLKAGAVVCDLSRPSNVSRQVKEARPDVPVIDGGVVAVPGLPALGWNFGFETGYAYACMAETMLLALEHHYEHTSLGANLQPATIHQLEKLALKHGFQVAQLRSFDRPLNNSEWQRIMAARQHLRP